MEIHHKVKPLHGWREFLGEVGIVVLGVLLALTAEQVAEAIRWHDQIAQARASLGDELGDNLASGVIRLRTYACVERRLDEVSAIVDRAERDGRLPPVGDIGFPYNPELSHGVWDGVLSGEAAGHLSREERVDLSALYSDIADIAQVGQQEMIAWSEIAQLIGPGRPFNSVDASGIRTAIGHARFQNRFMTLVSAGLIRNARYLPFPINVEPIRAAGRQPIAEAHACMAISGAIPKTYGQAPWKDAVAPMIRKIEMSGRNESR